MVGTEQERWTVGSNGGEWPGWRSGRGNQVMLANIDFVWTETESHQSVLSEHRHNMALLFLFCSACCVEKGL